MSSNPVIFLAFANSSTSPLKRLSDEDDLITRILHKRAVKEHHFQIHRESHADLDNLRKYFTSYKDQIFLFHYAGHAGGEQLFLEGGEAKSGGLAQMLAEQKNLKFVFLNGCSSEGQVDYLLELGIPVVIATSAPIEDDLAVKFSEHFYEALVQDSTFQEAYDQASNYLQAKGQGEEQFETRSLMLFDAPDEPTFKWGLFSHPDKKDVLNEKLPSTNTQQISLSFQADAISFKGISVNGQLITTLSETLKDYNPKLKDALENVRQEEEWEDEEDWDDDDWGEEEGTQTVDTRLIQQAILDSLPAPIAIQVRKLFSFDQNETGIHLDRLLQQRLSQLERTADVLIELLAFSLLSQFWDIYMEAKEEETFAFDLQSPTIKAIQTYFELSSSEVEAYDYRRLMIPLWENLSETEAPLFMDEFEKIGPLMKDHSSFIEAWEYLLELKRNIHADKITSMGGQALSNACLTAEKHLCEIMKPMGFLTKYKLVTVKNISLRKYRHRKPIFSHEHVELDMITVDFKDKKAPFIDHADSQSVIWMSQKKRSIGKHLSLSPFIIDWYAWTGYERSKLFFYKHKEDGEMNYVFVEKPMDTLKHEIEGKDKDKDIGFKKKVYERMQKQLKRQLNDFSKEIWDREVV